MWQPRPKRGHDEKRLKIKSHYKMPGQIRVGIILERQSKVVAVAAFKSSPETAQWLVGGLNRVSVYLKKSHTGRVHKLNQISKTIYLFFTTRLVHTERGDMD